MVDSLFRGFTHVHHLLGLNDHLGGAVEVAQDDEGEVLAHLADVFHPAGQGDGLARVAESQLAAGVGSGLKHIAVLFSLGFVFILFPDGVWIMRGSFLCKFSREFTPR